PRRGTRAARAHLPVDAGELHRVEPRTAQDRDGRNGAARRSVPTAARCASSGIEGENPQGPLGIESVEQAGLRMTLQEEIHSLVASGVGADREAARATFARLRDALSSGAVRAAEPDPSSAGGWRVNTWVKRGILLGFRLGDLIDLSIDQGRWPFFDKDTLPTKRFPPGAGVRIVPGGSSVRDGAYIAPGVI